jgi:hypothetical protein
MNWLKEIPLAFEKFNTVKERLPMDGARCTRIWAWRTCRRI